MQNMIRPIRYDKRNSKDFKKLLKDIDKVLNKTKKQEKTNVV